MLSTFSNDDCNSGEILGAFIIVALKTPYHRNKFESRSTKENTVLEIVIERSSSTIWLSTPPAFAPPSCMMITRPASLELASDVIEAARASLVLSRRHFLPDLLLFGSVLAATF